MSKTTRLKYARKTASKIDNKKEQCKIEDNRDDNK